MLAKVEVLRVVVVVGGASHSQTLAGISQGSLNDSQTRTSGAFAWRRTEEKEKQSEESDVDAAAIPSSHSSLLKQLGLLEKLLSVRHC